jgi:hypothetical protein
MKKYTAVVSILRFEMNIGKVTIEMKCEEHVEKCSKLDRKYIYSSRSDHQKIEQAATEN